MLSIKIKLFYTAYNAKKDFDDNKREIKREFKKIATVCRDEGLQSRGS